MDNIPDKYKLADWEEDEYNLELYESFEVFGYDEGLESFCNLVSELCEN